MIPKMKSRPASWLQANVQRANICEDFTESELNSIGADVLFWLGVDDESRSEWKEHIERGMAIAKQTIDKGTVSIGEKSAKTTDPLIAEASMNFAARAMAEVVRGKDIVKTEVVGDDPSGEKEARAKRVSQFMSFQLLKQQPEWIPDTDQLLTSLPIIGMYYKKTYRDTALNRNVSCSLSPLDVIVHNDTKTLALADRISWRFKRNRNYVIEQIRAQNWNDIEKKLSPDEDAPLQDFIEQQCWYDLDDDGYKEPYLVTVHKESGAVCRICVCYDEEGLIVNGSQVARITPLDYYTEFAFLPQPDGSFHKMGFAQLLGAINEEINIIQNQLIDSGTIANLRPGFIGKGGKMPAGGIRVQLGRLTPVECTGQDLRANIYFPDFAGPSDTLFKVLSQLDEKGHRLASISEGMQGEQGGANVPATTVLALLDQALKVYTSILWRQYRSFEQEFIKLYLLNAKNVTDEEYQNIVDFPGASVANDFNTKNCDIEPVMDPRASSEALRLARLNAMAQAASMPPAVGRLYLVGIGLPQKDIDTIFPPVDPNAAPPPNPEMIKIQGELLNMQHTNGQKDRELDQKEAEIEQKEVLLIKQLEKLDVEIVLIKAQSILALANAEKAEVGTQVGIYKGEMEQLNADRDHELAVISQQAAAESAKEGTDGDGDNGTQQADATATPSQQGGPTDNAALPGPPADTGTATGAGSGNAGPDDSGGALGQPGGSDSGSGLPVSPAEPVAG